MNINRHNYEEFFILYMDNELCPEDRRMVETFVQQHPDLKEELDMLLQYKLVPDTDIRFEGKEELLKDNGHPPITQGNYDEWLSLYIDDELSAEQKTRVENCGEPGVMLGNFGATFESAGIILGSQNIQKKQKKWKN